MKKVMNMKTLAMLVAGVALLALPLFAAAEDKLVVQDAAQNNVFTVDDAGVLKAKKGGFGTLNPQSSVTISPGPP